MSQNLSSAAVVIGALRANTRCHMIDKIEPVPASYNISPEFESAVVSPIDIFD